MFFFDIVWLVTIIIDAPKDAIKAKIIPWTLRLSDEGLKARKSPKKVVTNKILIMFWIFSFVMNIDIVKTIIG